MIQIIKDRNFFVTLLDKDNNAQSLIKEDIAKGYEGTFLQISKKIKNEDFLKFYQGVLENFKKEIKTDGQVTHVLSWVNEIKQWSEIIPHTFSLELDDPTFILAHYVQLNEKNPKIFYILNEEEFDLENITENSVVIFDKDITHGIKQNQDVESMVLFFHVFSIKS